MKPLTVAATAPVVHETSASTPKRVAIFLYGVTCYAIGVGGLFALVATMLGILPFFEGPIVIGSTAGAILFNVSLVAVFGIQHAIMARPEFKARWTRTIPPAMERPTFTLLAGGIMGCILFFWQPLDTVVWSVGSPVLRMALYALAACGWTYMLGASFAIDHFELFGLRQVWRNLRGKDQDRPPFVQRLMYRFDRHPLMTGMLIGFWSAPTMTLGHLVLSAALTTYMILGVSIEERDLVRAHGDSYRTYRRSVGTIVPRLGARD